MKPETNNKAHLMGEYLMTLPPSKRVMCGQRVKIIASFVESPFEISSKGYKQFVSIYAADLTGSKRRYLTDFLFYCGVRVGGVRKQEGKIVQQLDEVSNNNREKISAFISWCMKQKDYSESTLRIKSYQMRLYFRYFNEFNLDNCRNFIVTMEHNGRHPKTLNMYMMTLRHYGEFVKKPVALKRIGVPNTMSTENVPNESEYKKFLEWCMENGRWNIYWPVRILGSTGMRRSELSQATWQDILNAEFFPRCKGKKHRSIFFPEHLIKDLRQWLIDKNIDVSRPILWSERNKAPYSNRGFDLTYKIP